MLKKTQLDALAAQAVHMMEFRLMASRDIPIEAHKAIRNIGASLRDDIMGGKTLFNAARATERILAEENLRAARELGL